MCFKIRFELDWQPIGGIGHLLCSRKGDAKGGWRGSASYNFGREAAPSGSQASGAKTPFLNAKAAPAAQIGRRRRAIPTLGKRVRYRAKFGALAPCEFLVGTPRRRGPKFQARRRRCWMQRRLPPRKSDGGGAPSLPWAQDWRSRAVVRQ